MGAEIAAEHLAPVAAQVVVVQDREGDIYPVFTRRPDAVELVVRAAQDRVLAGGGRLFSAAAEWPALGTSHVKVQPKRPGDKGRTATVTIKAGTVTLRRPSSPPNRGEPPTLTLGLVEVRGAAVPKGNGKPLLWHSADDAESDGRRARGRHGHDPLQPRARHHAGGDRHSGRSAGICPRGDGLSVPGEASGAFLVVVGRPA